ncbi:MAG: CHAT domain-containing protein [Chryseolinea sp.]
MLKFVAAKIVGRVKNRLERDVVEGIVYINDIDPSKWKPIKSLPNLPKEKPANVLLFIHGTFSTTVGGFGALGGTPWGIAFLKSAIEHYDAVIGFNHFTLKLNPKENADTLFKLLQQIPWNGIPTFDIITHSRGGLVTRSLIEKVLPSSTWKPKIRKAIFVACTNEGTLLASPKNWDQLVTTYTNLAVGASRVLGLILPQSKVVTTVLSDIIDTIGSLVKYFASTAVTDRIIPGLSAMEPVGNFVDDINLIQDGQPTIDQSNYYVITSDFKPTLNGNHEPKELPKRLLQLASSGLMAQLMKESNDLVVNVTSMSAIDKAAGNYVRDKYEFGENNQVYHTNYFTRPEVANSITRWLNLPSPIENSALKRLTRGTQNARVKAKRMPTSLNVEVKGLTLPQLYNFDFKRPISSSVDIDIITMDFNGYAGDLQSRIKSMSPSYVVIQKRGAKGTQNFAYTGEQALDIISRYDFHHHQKSIGDVFDLSHAQTWQSFDIEEKSQWPLDLSGHVVTDNEMPIGVVPRISPPPSAEVLAKMSQSISSPETDVDKIVKRRSLPSFAPSAGSRSIRVDAEDPKSKLVKSYFYGQMKSVVKPNAEAIITVTVSRHDLQFQDKNETASDSGQVHAEKPLIVRVLCRKGFLLVDNEKEKEILVHAIGKNPNYETFKVRANEIEQPGEIIVLVRQGQTNIVKLTLRPTISSVEVAAVKTIHESKSAETGTAMKYSLNQLWITEDKSDKGTIYEFRITSDGLNFRGRGKSKLIADPRSYVENIFKQIEERWSHNDTDYDNFVAALRAYGGDLFRELVPVEIQKTLWNHRYDIDSIQLISDEPFIPWEIVHLRDPDKKGMPDETWFLGDLGLIRWLEAAGNEGWPADEIKVRQGKVKYVIPDYPVSKYKLPYALEEKEFLVSKFNAVAVDPVPESVRNSISHPGSFDILHFACHGSADTSNISEAVLLLKGKLVGTEYIEEQFSSTEADTYSNLSSEDSSPMIVLNSCQTGKSGYKLTGIGGFAASFLHGGAGAFIGALWSINDLTARDFAIQVYGALADGYTLAEAAKRARQSCKVNKDATWLAYVVYGHPHMKLKII